MQFWGFSFFEMEIRKKFKINEENGMESWNLIEIQESSDIKVGIGGRVREASLLLVRFLSFFIEDQNGMKQGSKILELGSGTGLVSISLSKLGMDVYPSDLPKCLPLIKRNLELNQVQSKANCVSVDWEKEENPNELGELKGIEYVVAADPFTNLLNLRIFLDVF